MEQCGKIYIKRESHSKAMLGDLYTDRVLVVELIIGILAAITWPQYETGVLKSRMHSALPAMYTVRKAKERYYMANGSYTDDSGSWIFGFSVKVVWEISVFPMVYVRIICPARITAPRRI